MSHGVTMSRAVVGTLVLLAVSAILGATVFREQIARAAPPITSVFVTNDSDNPVPIRDADRPADDPVTLSRIRVFPTTANSFVDELYTVPANKRLVIEYMHAALNLPTGDQASCDLHFPGYRLEFPLVHLRAQAFTDPPEQWGADLSARLYLDAGQHVEVGCSDGFAFISQLRSMHVLVSGHLVAAG
jgi:hypothetical protein